MADRVHVLVMGSRNVGKSRAAPSTRSHGLVIVGLRRTIRSMAHPAEPA